MISGYVKIDATKKPTQYEGRISVVVADQAKKDDGIRGLDGVVRYLKKAKEDTV